jgi:hypothetical protein
VPVLILLFSFGFQRFSSNWEADLAPKTKVAAEAARVFCEGDGVHALTLRVGSRPDGIHLTIDDRLEGNADLSVSHSGGGMGFSAPRTSHPEDRVRLPQPLLQVDEGQLCVGKVGKDIALQERRDGGAKGTPSRSYAQQLELFTER